MKPIKIQIEEGYIIIEYADYGFWFDINTGDCGGNLQGITKEELCAISNAFIKLTYGV